MKNEIELSLLELQHLFKKQIEYLDYIINAQSFEMVKVKAQIKNLEWAKKKNYNGKIYNIVLTDGYIEIKTQSDLNIIEGINDLDFIEATCLCLPTKDYKSESLTMCPYIMSIRSLKQEEIPTSINHNTTKLKSLNLTRNRFPKQNNKIFLSLIYSSSSSAKVHHDFLNSLGDIKDQIRIEELQTRFNHTPELLATIDSAQGNVIALIRGGGDANDLIVFDQDEVLQKISELKAYRIAGVGHSPDNNLVNTVVDYSAITPTDAGNHLKEQLMQNNKDMWEISKLKKDNQGLLEKFSEIERRNSELHKKLMNTPAQDQAVQASSNINSTLILLIVILIMIIIFK